MTYERTPLSDVLQKAVVDPESLQERCPGCGSNAIDEEDGPRS